MNRKQRAYTIETAAIAGAGAVGVFAVPALINARDNLALLAGVLLLAGWVGWAFYFIYRLNRENTK